MTDTIDKKIVEMAFENDKFEKGVGASLNTIDKLKKSLNFEDAAKSMNGITESANRVNLASLADSANKISSRFSAMGIVAITTLVNIANAAYQTGVRMIKALTVDPIKTGLDEYETKLNAVQTILANTQKEGTDLATVTKALNVLNTYADKTIYNFQQMTRNVGTFTAAGVKLDVSVQAIKGIANLAAISGSNADQASTAMYQLSQALSSGTVKLMDWNSVVNAGMGGQVFQDALKETARLHGVAIDQMIKDEGSFRETLQHGWITSQILTETLAKFTGDLNADQLRTMGYSQEQIASIIKLGQTANDAATKVKTFSQLFDTLKEAAQSGWAQTWELIIGNFDEAKTFLTDLNNWFGNVLSASANARNTMLQGWKDLGGRTKLIEAFQNALNSIVLVINPIKEGMRQIFPPTTSEQLFKITEGIAAFTKKLIIGSETADKLKRIFAGVFAVVDIVKMGVLALVRNLGLLIGSFSDTGKGIFDLSARFGDWLVRLRDALKTSDTFNKVFGNIARVLKSVIDGVSGFFKSLFTGFSSTEKVTKSESLSKFLDALGKKFESFGKLGVIISKIFGILSRLAAKLGPIVGSIAQKLGEIVNKVLDNITKGLDNLDVNKVLDVLNKGLLGGVLLSLNGFVKDSKGIIGGGLFGGILLSIKKFIDEGGSVFTGVKGILDGVKGSLEAYQKTLKANSLLKIAAAIGILAVSIIALTLVDQTKLVNATAVIGGMFVALASTLDVFEKTTSGGSKLLALTASLIGISGALLLMAGTVVILGKLDPGEAAQGLIAVGTVLGLLLLFQKNAASGVSMVGVTVGILGLSVAMLGLSLALRSLGKMDTDTLAKGLVAMGVALGIIAIGLNAMTATFAGSASLLVAAGAILVLTASIKALATLSLKQVGISLLALAGVFTVLGLAAAILTPLAPTLAIVAVSLLAIGVAAAAFGVAIGAVGIGLGALAAGIVTLATLSSAGIAAVTLVITGLAALLPLLAVQAAKAMTALIVEVAKSAPKIAVAIAGIGLAMLKGFVGITPQVAGAIMTLIKQLLIQFEKNIPAIVKVGGEILVGFLRGIRANIAQVTTTTIDIVNAYLKAVASKMPEIAQSGWNLIISWINALAASAQSNIPKLMDAVRNLGLAIVKGILTGLIEGHEDAKKGILELVTIFINGFKEALGIHSPSTVFTQLTLQIIQGIILGFLTGTAQILTTVINLGNKMVASLKTKYDSMVAAGKDLVTGFALGISKYIGDAVNAAASLAKAVLDKIRNVFDSHSPARKLIDVGEDVDSGLAIGITKFAGVVSSAIGKVGNSTVSALTNVISKVSDSVDTNMEFNPTVRPVVDLSEVQAGSNQIDKMLADKKVSVNLAADTAASISAQQAAQLSQTVAPTGQPVPPITLTQINNSPKELSRLEIYRQTRNLLLQTKGMVGAQ